MRAILIFLLFQVNAYAADGLKKADQLFAKGEYQAALEAYAPALKLQGEDGLKALYRCVESEALLYRYGEAAQRVSDIKLPPDLVWQGRLLLLRAETGRQFLQQYGYSLPQDEEAGTSDVTKLTMSQWRRRVAADYNSLWYLRKALRKARLEDQGYFVDLKGAELAYTPTLWDFAVLRWSSYLLSGAESSGKLPDAASFAEPSYRGKYIHSSGPAAKAAAILEDASRVSPGFAGEYWKVQRLMIPFEHPDKVSGYDREKLRARALKTLTKWRDSFKTAHGRAWASYRAAAFESEAGNFGQTVELCKDAEGIAPVSRPASFCSKMRAEIEMPRLELQLSFAPPPGKGAVTVTARNLPKLYFRAYKASLDDLKNLSIGAGRGAGDWSGLRSLSAEQMGSVIARKPQLEWSSGMDYGAPYAYAEKEIDPPALAKGLYILAASGDEDFEEGASLIKGGVLNVTDVFLLGTTGAEGDPEDLLFDPAAPDRKVTSDVFRFYAVNALTGKPLPGAGIDVAYNIRGHEWARRKLKTGEDGAAEFSHQFKLTGRRNVSVSADPLLSHDGTYAYWAYPKNFYFSAPDPVRIFVETDRPVYRPGQEVKFKATALIRAPGGYKVYNGKAKLKLTARDGNWQNFFSKTMSFTGLGSAAGSFTIPEGRLLGSYSITAELTDFGRGFSGSARFGVEEYKRPEFEVKLPPPDKAWRYGHKAAVSGEARYYFGAPVPGAAVKYRVVRSRYIPRYCWYWGWFYGGGPAEEVASGRTVTDDDGKFSFSFTPEPESERYGDYPSSYRVEAEALDAGGRTIAASSDYRAGSRSYLFDVSPQAGFFTPAAPAAVEVRLMDLNGSRREGSAEYLLYKLEGEPKAPPAGPLGIGGRNPSLEQAFSDVPDGPLVRKGRIVLGDKGDPILKLKSLRPGVYRLKLSAKDPFGGKTESSVILVSASPDPGGNASLRLPPVTLIEWDSYQPGGTARALIGAPGVKGAKFLEVLAGTNVLSRTTVKSGGLSVVSVKVGAGHRGGFGLRWLGAGGFKVYSGMSDVQVPRKDKAASLSLDYSRRLKPGQKVSWELKARDARGRPLSGEALVKVFDRSLEYYAADAGFWTDHLYGQRHSGGELVSSLFLPRVVSVPVRQGFVRRMLDAFRKGVREEKLASLRMASSQVRVGRGGFFGKSLGFEMEEGVASTDGAAMFAPQSRGDVRSVKKKAAPAQSSPVKVRSDFSETAFYEPQLEVSKGKGAFSFRIPERLTSWKIGSYLLTRDAKRGSFSAETVTRQDLMVRLDIPRFFREGDKSRLTALVTNDTDRALSGEATLSLTLDGAAAHDRFGVKSLSRAFKVKPGGTEPLYWDIEAPRGPAAYKARVIARAGRLTDGQENDLPVLPSRERLVASQVAALDGDSSKTFGLPELKRPDPTREVESLHLEVQPQLILTVINSLPFLVNYPYECTEQLLNRYVPLAITNSFYSKYPELRAAVAKVPKRTAITPEWDRDNPVRLMTLMETPWESRSRGRKPRWPVVDMLDPEKVAGEKEDAFSKLKSYQLSDGSFPWFPGGRSSLYMTLYLLEGLAEASRYGVDIPEDMARRALSYVLGEIPKHMKAEPGETSTILYGAYVVTSFPAEWRESGKARTYAKAWVDYADRHSRAMTAFGKAYASYVYMRLGEKKKASSYLDRAMDGARSDGISGVYWTPEKISWLWYNDTVEKHAFLLRTLLAVRPKDPKIPGMVRWLLFNRKSGEWKSTKASAAAIYSLLDVMKARGSLDKGESFSVKFGDMSEKLDLKPFDWVSRPLRWSKYGAQISGEDLSPSIEKKGPGLTFASFSGIYTTDRQAEESPDGMMNVSRRYFLRSKNGGHYLLKPLSDGDTISVGDQVEVHLTVRTRGRFEYVHIKDPKPAGFEAEELRSGWKWDRLSRYEEPRDSLTNFFVERMPHGEYVLKYRLRPTVPGTFKAGAAVIQSMYAPEFAAHSAGFTLKVK